VPIEKFALGRGEKPPLRPRYEAVSADPPGDDAGLIAALQES